MYNSIFFYSIVRWGEEFMYNCTNKRQNVELQNSLKFSVRFISFSIFYYRKRSVFFIFQNMKSIKTRFFPGLFIVVKDFSFSNQKSSTRKLCVSLRLSLRLRAKLRPFVRRNYANVKNVVT